MIDEYKKVATKLISLKSVSADSAYKEDCKETAVYLASLLSEYGITAEIFEGDGNPIVFGSYEVDPTAQTCLLYGHYDVQPASLEDGWNSDPFVLDERDGKFFGRGIMDDKCQFLIHILAIGKLIQEKKLGYNIKFLFEGNEEVGSPYIEKFIATHAELLSCDFVLISDGEMTNGKPTIELGNRGLINATLTIKTAGNDLHSGLYGGSAPNAIDEASKFITALYTKSNKIAIPGFYDDVDKIDMKAAIPFSFENYSKNTGAKVIQTEEGLDFYTQAGQRPSIEVTGIQAGYTGEGYKNSIPHKATVKFNTRLVKSQEPEKIAESIKAFIADTLPDYVDYKLDFGDFNNPVRIQADNEFIEKAKRVLSLVFHEDPIHRYIGGTEPVVLYFANILGKPQVMVPFANEDGAMHGSNENFTIANIEKGLAFSEKFFSLE